MNAEKDKKKTKLKKLMIMKKLYLQNGKAKKLKLSDAKELAIKMRIARAELRDLISERYH